ncbi:hypothetical protein Clacol_005957 [Clathrus columnatus]|uniref:Uncharacterized protein n=1 Tax=Clathrus columnatus TaxID=1419009 RepID=A0AAV5AFP1_9AGAM|nr:hypothetical protein Clacol_005957 [Clathrus columnatus]
MTWNPHTERHNRLTPKPLVPASQDHFLTKFWLRVEQVLLVMSRSIIRVPTSLAIFTEELEPGSKASQLYPKGRTFSTLTIANMFKLIRLDNIIWHSVPLNQIKTTASPSHSAIDPTTNK